MRALLCLLVWFCGSLAIAQTSPPDKTTSEGTVSDSLIIAGELNHNSLGAGGRGGTLDWVHSPDNGRTFTAGLGIYSISDSHWAVGRLGAAFHPYERVFLHAGATLGHGQAQGSSFGYQLYELGASYRALQRLLPEFREQYVRIGDVRGHLLRAGALLLPLPSVSVQLDYSHSLGGNLNTSFFFGRVDYRTHRTRPFGGFATGRTAPQVFNAEVGRQATYANLRQGFFGVAFPLSRYELTTALDFLHLGSNVRTTATVSVRFPVSKHRAKRSVP